MTPSVVRLAASASALLLALAGPAQSADPPPRPGATANLDGSGANATPDFVRTSQFVTVRDGTRLAIDILRPARGGVAVEGRLPVVLQATPYQRAMVREGKLVTAAQSTQHLAALLNAGYVVASLDIRGRGASFGEASSTDTGTDRDRLDLYDVIEWLAVQPWSTGDIGMAGCSYVARTIYWAASAMPPHLKAIAPCSAPLDSFASVMRPGGVNQQTFLTAFDGQMRMLDGLAVPVDEDRDGSLAKAAIAEHMKKWDTGGAATMGRRGGRPWRDSPEPGAPNLINEWNYASNFAISRLPVLQFGGWRDLFPQDTVRWQQTFAQIGLKQRLVIGPWYHCLWYLDPISPEEHVLWFDRFLKGKDNGADRRPSIRYYVMGAPKGAEWREADRWPLPGSTPVRYHLSGGASGTVRGVHDGSLALSAPRDAGADAYVVDYDVTTTGLATRWLQNRPGSSLDTSKMDAKSLTYTTAPFEAGTEFTGFPVISFWATSTTANPDFYVYVSVVNPDGATTLMTDGQLRGSNRKLRTPPWPSHGLPWQGGFASDGSPFKPGQPEKIELTLYPTSFYVQKGQRVRVTINNFDKGNFDTPREASAPTIRLLRDPAHPATLTLTKVSRDHRRSGN